MSGDEYVKSESASLNSQTISTSDKELFHPKEYIDALNIFRVLVCVIGIIGNATVIFAILADRNKTVPQWYLLQLALADTLFLCTVPFRIAEEIYGGWIFSLGLCKVKETMLYVNYYCSVILLTVMSIDRYIAICRMFSQRLQRLRKRASVFGIVLIIWAVSFLLSSPIMIYTEIFQGRLCRTRFDFSMKSYGYDPQTAANLERSETDESELTSDNLLPTSDSTRSMITTNDATLAAVSNRGHSTYQSGCSYADQPLGWKIIVFFNAIVMFVFPFTIMAVCYSLIAIQLKKSGVRSSGSAERNRTRASYMCFILVIIFLVCWLPVHAGHLAKMMEFCADLVKVTSAIAYTNSALNPFVYNFMGTNFRKHFRKKVTRFWTVVSEGCCWRRTSRKISRDLTENRQSTEQEEILLKRV